MKRARYSPTWILVFGSDRLAFIALGESQLCHKTRGITNAQALEMEVGEYMPVLVQAPNYGVMELTGQSFAVLERVA